MSPDELHDGHAHSNTGYQVQVFSIEPEWLQQTLEANQIEQVIGFEQLIVQDPTLFHSLQQLHHLLRQDNLSQLAKDCLPYQGFAPLLERYSYLKQPPSNRLANTISPYSKSGYSASLTNRSGSNS